MKTEVSELLTRTESQSAGTIFLPQRLSNSAIEQPFRCEFYRFWLLTRFLPCTHTSRSRKERNIAAQSPGVKRNESSIEHG